MANEDVKEKLAEGANNLLKENSDNELDVALKNRILNMDLKPIEKKNANDFSLLEYIGFVDEELELNRLNS